jgi:hypothetical protein
MHPNREAGKRSRLRKSRVGQALAPTHPTKTSCSKMLQLRWTFEKNTIFGREKAQSAIIRPKKTPNHREIEISPFQKPRKGANPSCCTGGKNSTLRDKKRRFKNCENLPRAPVGPRHPSSPRALAGGVYEIDSAQRKPKKWPKNNFKVCRTRRVRQCGKLAYNDCKIRKLFFGRS